MAPPEGRSTLARVRGNVANQGEAVHRALKEGKDMVSVLWIVGGKFTFWGEKYEI